MSFMKRAAGVYTATLRATMIPGDAEERHLFYLRLPLARVLFICSAASHMSFAGHGARPLSRTARLSLLLFFDYRYASLTAGLPPREAAPVFAHAHVL